MNFKNIIILFILVFLALYGCSSIRIVNSPTQLPNNIYFDNENYLMIKNPGTVENYIGLYNKWKKENKDSSFIKNYFRLYNFKSEADDKNNIEIFFNLSKKNKYK